MARGNKHIQVEGQMTFEMCLNTHNYVVQANDLIEGKQTLNVKAAKLIRVVIMQSVYEDSELRPYTISIKDFADILSIPTQDLYRDIDNITDNIIKNPVFIKSVKGKKTEWVKIPWVKLCQYDSDVGVTIQLNDLLKPFLLNLKIHYAQYPFDVIMGMKSVYAIRLFELFQKRIVTRLMPLEGVDIDFTIQELREYLGCEDKYPLFANFKKKVIDTAVSEINDPTKTTYAVNYTYLKSGKTVTGIRFHVNMSYHLGIMDNPEIIEKVRARVRDFEERQKINAL